MKLFLHLLALLLLVPLAAEARLVSMKAGNASVELPREWNYELSPKLKADWGRLLLSAKGPDGQFVLVAVQPMPAADPMKALAHLELLQGPARKEGWVVSSLRETLVDGMPFYSFTLTRKGREMPDLLMATTFTRQQAYTLQLGDPHGNVDEAPVLEAVWRSFRLLVPQAPMELQILPVGEVPTRPQSMVPVKWVVLGVLGVVVLIGTVQLILVLRSKARRHRRRERRAERMQTPKPGTPTSAEP
jgi:hypothetical protein